MRDPDLKGLFGRAWRLEQPIRTPSLKALLGAFLVHAPWSHPVHPYKRVGLAHLRPVQGAADAHKHYLEAEYELLILSVNPGLCPNPDPDKVAEGYPILSPYEVVVQFHGVGDLDAQRILERVIGGIVDGKLVPDEKWRSHWQDCVWDLVREFNAGSKPN